MFRLVASKIDPSWWAPAFLGGSPAGVDDWEPVEVVSRQIGQFAESAPEGSFQREVLVALAVVSSAMLAPESWDEPFKAFMVMGGRRSALPEDLTAEQFELLDQCLPLIEQAALRARVADALWFYWRRSDVKLLRIAVDAYVSTPLEGVAWRRRGADAWRRAVELLRRRGAAEAERLAEIASALHTRAFAGSVADGFMLVELVDLLRVAGGGGREGRAPLAAHLVEVASDAAKGGNLRLARHLERKAEQWFRSAGDIDAASAATERVGRLYESEADQRETGEGASFLASGILLEKAIATFRSLPRKYRLAHDLDGHVTRLRSRLAGVREATLESMHRFQSDPIDLTDAVADTRRRLSGLNRFEALAAYATIWPLADPERERTHAVELAEGSLMHLFSGATYSSDGRKVAVTDGGVANSDAAIVSDMARNVAMKRGIVATAFLVPGLEVISFEHRFDLPFVHRLCTDSPWVPTGHEELWARGIWHGLSGDFPSAVSVLVPQVEQALRRALKSDGVHTLFVDAASGVETEKGLPALLDMPEAVGILGPPLHFELSTLLVQQAGGNLRHDTAHGLLDDAAAWSAGAVFAWWLCLFLVVVPVLNMRRESRPETDHSDDGATGESQSGACTGGPHTVRNTSA